MLKTFVWRLKLCWLINEYVEKLSLIIWYSVQWIFLHWKRIRNKKQKMMKNLFLFFINSSCRALRDCRHLASVRLTVPADLTISTSPGTCEAVIPTGILLATAPANCDGTRQLIC